MGIEIKEKKVKLSKEDKERLKNEVRAEKERLLLKSEKSKVRKILFKKVTLSVIMVILVISMCLPYLVGLI